MSHASIRRAALVLWAASVFLLLMIVLFAAVMRPCGHTEAEEDQNVIATQPLVEKEQAEHVQLPMNISCTSLVVRAIASFDGAFYEDGSGTEVINVASLVLYNQSDSLIPYACVIVDTETTRYSFRAYMIPPRSSVLVPETSAQQYSPSGILNIFGWHTAKQSETSPEVKITEQGETSLRIQNISGQEICDLTIYFRKYVDGIYIGGKPYEIIIPCLPVEKTIVVCPKYYVSGYTRIVYYQ